MGARGLRRRGCSPARPQAADPRDGGAVRVQRAARTSSNAPGMSPQVNRFLRGWPTSISSASLVGSASRDSAAGGRGAGAACWGRGGAAHSAQRPTPRASPRRRRARSQPVQRPVRAQGLRRQAPGATRRAAALKGRHRRRTGQVLERDAIQAQLPGARRRWRVAALLPDVWSRCKTTGAAGKGAQIRPAPPPAQARQQAGGLPSHCVVP